MWREIDGNTQITGTGVPVKASFTITENGMLGIRPLGGKSFPKGTQVLFASPSSHAVIWVQDVEIVNGILQVSMEGFESAAEAIDDPYWTLSIGQHVDGGMLQCVLRDDKKGDKLNSSDKEFRDLRYLGEDAINLGIIKGVPSEAYPIQMGERGQLQLQTGPVGNRYSRAVACTLADIEKVKDGVIRLKIRCPESLEQPCALSIMPVSDIWKGYSLDTCAANAYPEGVFADTHTIYGDLDFNTQKAREGLWQFSCLVRDDRGEMFRIPVFLADPIPAVKYAESLEGQPISDLSDGVPCWFFTNCEHRTLLAWGEYEPNTHRAIGECKDKGSAIDTILEEIRNDYEINAVSARHITGDDWIWKVFIPGRDWSTADDIIVAVLNTKDRNRCLCPVVKIEKSEDAGTVIEIDTGILKSTIDNCKPDRWRVFISVFKGNHYFVLPMMDPGRIMPIIPIKETGWLRPYHSEEPVGGLELAGRTVVIVPGCSYRGDWRFFISERALMHISEFRCVSADIKLKRNAIRYKIACPLIEGIEWKGILISFRYQLEIDRREYYFAAKELYPENGYMIAVIDIDLNKPDFQPITWEVRMVYESKGDRYLCRIMAPAKTGKVSNSIDTHSIINNLFFTQTVRIKNGFCLSLGETTSGDCTLVIQKDYKYYGFGFRLKETVAMLIYYCMRKQLLKQNIFLVYEKFCSMAQDNGFYFFKYCMDNDMESVMKRRIYYIMDRAQQDYVNVKPYKDHVIQFMSLKHMVYVLAARLLISSDSRQHAYAWRSVESTIRTQIIKNKKSVFLQHGVIGLKKLEGFRRGTVSGASLFVASNETEKGFIINQLDYRPEQVVVTGLARWDVLRDKANSKERKEILMMPTWRSWLEETTDSVFLESEYYHKYMSLINSQKLKELLDAHELYLNFYIHPKLREHIEQFSSDTERIRLIPFGSEPLNELIMECSLLITDYSSVCWDVYYQGKPVIFYQFDIDKYNKTQGAYMDLRNDLFGDRTESQEELLNLLEEAIENGFDLKSQYAKMREGMYKYIDHNNSKRICEEISKRGW